MSAVGSDGAEGTEPRTLKAEAIELAARAEFEVMKQSVVELFDCEWATLPEVDGELPTPMCKVYYREQVSTAVETLARAGMLVRVVEQQPPTEDRAQFLANLQRAHDYVAQRWPTHTAAIMLNDLLGQARKLLPPGPPEPTQGDRCPHCGELIEVVGHDRHLGGDLYRCGCTVPVVPGPRAPLVERSWAEIVAKGRPT